MIFLEASAFSIITPDTGLVFWTFTIFVILWVILGRFAFKPIVAGLKDREKSIQDSLDSARKAKEEMMLLTSKNEELLKEAREEQARIINDAKNAANKILEDSREKAKEEYTKLVDSAKQAIEIEKMAALTDLKNQSALLGIEIAEKLLRQELSNKSSQEVLIQNLIEEAKLN